MTARAARLTMRVMANSTRPLAISASRPVLPDSPNFVAMFAAMLLPPGVSTRQLTSNEAASTSATAIVSPSARPRPSITALISPGRLGGSTAVLIISHRVAPSASAASRFVVGTWARTSREIAEMIGKIITSNTTACLLYTSDAADEEDSVDLGGRRIIKKKKKKKQPLLP